MEWNSLSRLISPVFRMIKAILIFNNQGKPRMTKFYQRYTESEQQAMIEVIPLFIILKNNNFNQEIFSLVSKREDGVCSFLEGGKLVKK